VPFNYIYTNTYTYSM